VGPDLLVGMGRFELPTSPTRKERSTKLSHIPTKERYLKAFLVGLERLSRTLRRGPQLVAPYWRLLHVNLMSRKQTR
jgi:hypothetical protein